PVPVWLVGTSMGTISAVSVASQLDTGGPDGIVLTSTVQPALSAGGGCGPRPTLLVPQQSGCLPVSPFSVRAAAALSVSPFPRHELLTFSSTRIIAGSNPCGALSPHGYLGIEGDVVHAIVEWIKASR